MLMTWNNDRTPSTDIVDSARKLMVDTINRLKAATAMDQAVDPLTIEQENELELLRCWH